VQHAVHYYAQQYPGKTVFMCTHAGTLRMVRMSITPFDFDAYRKDKERRKVYNATPEVHYFDTNTNQ
jgi:broad specificity phosphatase PhoE